MKTLKILIISKKHGIFCGMVSNYAAFTKDPLLCGTCAFAFDSRDDAEKFVSKFPANHAEEVIYKPILCTSNRVSLGTLIHAGLKEHVGYMLDVTLDTEVTMH